MSVGKDLDSQLVNAFLVGFDHTSESYRVHLPFLKAIVASKHMPAGHVIVAEQDSGDCEPGAMFRARGSGRHHVHTLEVQSRCGGCEQGIRELRQGVQMLAKEDVVEFKREAGGRFTPEDVEWVHLSSRQVMEKLDAETKGTTVLPPGFPRAPVLFSDRHRHYAAQHLGSDIVVLDAFMWNKSGNIAVEPRCYPCTSSAADKPLYLVHFRGHTMAIVPRLAAENGPA